jgi:hypothetical protein
LLLLLGGVAGTAGASVVVELGVADTEAVEVAVADALDDETDCTRTCCPANIAVEFIQEFACASNNTRGSV